LSKTIRTGATLITAFGCQKPSGITPFGRQISSGRKNPTLY
jgi:hypothetical protein